MDGNRRKELPGLWSAISHEIRTPLGVIMGMTDLSENDIYNVDLTKDCLSKIKDSTQDILQVVNSLTDYAAILQQNIVLQHIVFDFKALITELAMHAYLLTKQRGCHFNIHICDLSEDTLIGDEARLSQILSVLLGIAIRHTAPGSMIDFTVKQTGISSSSVFVRFSLRSPSMDYPDDLLKFLNQNDGSVNTELLNPIGILGLAELNALYLAHLMGGKLHAVSAQERPGELVMDLVFERNSLSDSDGESNLFAHQRILITAETREICCEREKMLRDMGVQFESAADSSGVLEKIGEAESSPRPYTVCVLCWDLLEPKCVQLIRDIRELYGPDIILLVSSQDPASQQETAKNLTVNYLIDENTFRSTLFDALICAEKGIRLKEMQNKEELCDLGGHRILVAEDVALNMEVISRLLSRVGAEVICVENGMEAVMQFNKKPSGYFSAILLDINMPVMDGYEAARAIRTSGRADASVIPIYAMTANAFREDVEKALDAGMDGHIAKPIDVQSLYSILDQAIHRKESTELLHLRDLADTDPLTGCLNRRGFEQQMKDIIENNVPIAYLAIDIDDFKQINDRFGHETGDKILRKVVRILKQKFRATDLFVRFGGDEFAVILVDYKNRALFLSRRMEEINDELLHPGDSLPPITISAGAVIAGTGYTKDLSSSADKALYRSKNKGKGTCTIFEGIEEITEEELNEEEELYTEDLHYTNDKIRVLVNRDRFLHSRLMTQNKPVGYVTGFYEKRLPVYSFNGFFPPLLDYTISEFKALASNGVAYFVHPDDLPIFLQNDREEEILLNEKVRLRSKSGDYYWFNVDYILTRTSEQKKFWLASLKNIDEYLAGSLCADDFRMVSIIDPAQGTITFEKGAYLVAGSDLRCEKKYNYSDMLSRIVKEGLKESDPENYLERASLSNVCCKLDMSGVYEFNVYQKLDTANYAVVRHKYRYLSEKDKTILCTWELLGQRAEIDDLTDTLNESGFYRAAEAILRSGSSDAQIDLLYFNVSGFKAWNSILGMNRADILLKLISRRIKNSALEPLCIGRLFSDHFACLVDRSKYDPALITRICTGSFEIDKNRIQLQMQCGILHISQADGSVRSMCDKARLAIRQITNEHAEPYFEFTEALNDKYLQQKTILNQVGHALERKEIKVFYQPIVDTKTGKIASAEALIRWIQPDGRIISPAAFIPALEEQGYIADVDTYAQNTVSALLARRHSAGQKIVPVSVNVSRMDFLNQDFAATIKALVSAHDTIRDYMRVEVTESSYTDVGKPGEDLLKELKKQGIKILMDDFGTGYSTLSGITGHLFDIVKIDMSFIRDLGKGNGSEAVIQSTISMCHALDMRVIAEGVETRPQYEFLLESGCDYIQGYYFYKPVTEADFEALLEKES